MELRSPHKSSLEEQEGQTRLAAMLGVTEGNVARTECLENCCNKIGGGPSLR